MLKAALRGVAALAVAPARLSYAIRRRLLDDGRAFEGSMQAFGLLPGLPGQYLRRAFLSRTAHCAPSACVQFGALFSDPRVRIEEDVYIGPRCHLGWVHLERGVLLAAGVHIPSGAATHGTGDPTRPIREQPVHRTRVRVGEGTWIGSGAVIMADVGRHCVIGAGAVVTAPIPDYVVAAGVPARVIRDRRHTTGPSARSPRTEPVHRRA
jgi:acetyltransferase-like isoleucine patch superfamily enzyme